MTLPSWNLTEDFMNLRASHTNLPVYSMKEYPYLAKRRVKLEK